MHERAPQEVPQSFSAQTRHSPLHAFANRPSQLLPLLYPSFESALGLTLLNAVFGTAAKAGAQVALPPSGEAPRAFIARREGAVHDAASDPDEANEAIAASEFETLSADTLAFWRGEKPAAFTLAQALHGTGR